MLCLLSAGQSLAFLGSNPHLRHLRILVRYRRSLFLPFGWRGAQESAKQPSQADRCSTDALSAYKCCSRQSLFVIEPGIRIKRAKKSI